MKNNKQSISKKERVCRDIKAKKAQKSWFYYNYVVVLYFEQ